MTLYLSIAAAGAVVAVLGLLLRKPLSGTAAVPPWLASGVAAFLLGLGIGFALLHQLGYRWSEQAPVIQTVGNVVAGGVGGGQGGAPGGGGGGGGGGMMGGGGPGGGGQGGGGQGGNQPPVTPAAVATLVKKLAMLEGGLKIEINDEQAAKLKEALEGLDADDTMSNEEAAKRLEACTALLSEEQKALVASIELPRRRAPQGGGGGAGGAMPGDARAGRPDAALPPPNPFKGEDEGKSLESLRQRLAQRAK